MRSILLPAVLGMSAFGLGASAGAARADEAPARLRVLLPADATLTIDGAKTQSTSDVRDFVTPPLEAGKDSQYDLRAHFVSAGNEVTVDRRVTVRAGQQTVADLNPPGYAGNQAAPTAYAPFINQGPMIRFDSGPVRGYVGGARDNWKPDSSDPFYPWD